MRFPIRAIVVPPPCGVMRVFPGDVRRRHLTTTPWTPARIRPCRWYSLRSSRMRLLNRSRAAPALGSRATVSRKPRTTSGGTTSPVARKAASTLCDEICGHRHLRVREKLAFDVRDHERVVGVEVLLPRRESGRQRRRAAASCLHEERILAFAVLPFARHVAMDADGGVIWACGVSVAISGSNSDITASILK